MLLVLMALLGGSFHGNYLQSTRRHHAQKFLEDLLMPCLYGFLFFVGIGVGQNHAVFSHINIIGIKALILALSGIGGSLLLAPLAKALVYKNAYIKNRMMLNTFREPTTYSTLSGIRSSALLVCAFGAGTFLAQSHFLDSSTIAELQLLIGPSLYLLLWTAGVAFGGNPGLIGSLRLLPFVVLILPVSIVVGTLAATGLASQYLLQVPFQQGMSVSAGMGYYSLSCAMITARVDPGLGLLALLVNLVREVITIGLAPLIVRFFGPFGLLSVGGTTTCSSSLPMIHLCAGKEFALLGMISGVILTLMVPLLILALV